MRVVGALLISENRVLLVRKGEKWVVPGGRIEEGESPEEAVRREVREETGLTVVNMEILEVVRRNGVEWWVFLVKKWEGEMNPHDPDGEIQEARWFPISRAPVGEETRRILENLMLK